MTSLNKKQIKDLLPHREPMLLIDELVDIKKLSSATAIVNVKKDSFFVNGHFPGEPVMPGVLIVEAMAQTAGVVVSKGFENSNNKSVLFMSVSKAKFRKPVFPNEKIKANVVAMRSKGRVWRFEGNSFNEKEELVCSSKWSAMIMDRNNE